MTSFSGSQVIELATLRTEMYTLYKSLVENESDLARCTRVSLLNMMKMIEILVRE